MGREKLPGSEEVAAAIETLGRRVAEAVVRGDFDLARALTEEAIGMRAALSSERDSEES